MLKIFYIFITSLISLSSAHAETLKVFEFTEKELSALEIRKVRGADNKTVYSVGSNENGNYLKAVADNAASGLGKEIKIDLNKTPFINITWKIEKDLRGIKENTKKGHDYAARVFAIKKLELHLYQIEQLIMFFQVIVKLVKIDPVHIQKNQ